VGIVLGGGAALLVSSFNEEAFGLRAMAVIFGVFSAVSLLIAARSVRGVEKRATEAPIKRLSFALYTSLIREKYVSILLIFKFLGAVATGCLMAAIPYFAKHVLADVGASTFGVGIYTVVSAVFIPFWYKRTQRTDKRHLLLIANSLGAVVLLSTAMLVKPGGTGLFFLGCGLLGAIMSAYLIIPYSLVPDLVDYYRHKTGLHHESVYFGVWSTVHQLGIAASGVVLGTVLSFAGYDSSLEVQSGPALLAVRLSFGLIPGVFLVLAAVVLQKYGITRQVYQQVRSELEGGTAPVPEGLSPAGGPA
jgi:GPH family glycoside/pentoside/hexuronide:cation symporter